MLSYNSFDDSIIWTISVIFYSYSFNELGGSDTSSKREVSLSFLVSYILSKLCIDLFLSKWLKLSDYRGEGISNSSSYSSFITKLGYGEIYGVRSLFNSITGPILLTDLAFH